MAEAKIKIGDVEVSISEINTPVLRLLRDAKEMIDLIISERRT